MSFLIIGSAFSQDVALAQGALTNGAKHAGVIQVGGLDTWTIQASFNDSITASIGKVSGSGPDPNFFPRIRLRGPDGALLSDREGNNAAEIDVRAPSTGTYTVLVSASTCCSQAGPGRYVLTVVKRPGPCTVSSGDEGGPITNGVNRAGVIQVGDLDPWTFQAKANDNIAASIGKVLGSGPDPNFFPRIRLRGPDGALLSDREGNNAAEIDVRAPTTGTYTVLVSASTCCSQTGSGSYSFTVSGLTAAPSPPSVNDLTASPSTITAGQSSTLSWTTTNATTVSISGVTGTQLTIGSVSVSPTLTTTYTLTATGPGGTATVTAIVVNSTVPPVIVSFAANASTITAGQFSTLSWTTTSATTVSISGITGTQPVNGSLSVSPTTTTTYTLTATGTGGTATATATVLVSATSLSVAQHNALVDLYNSTNGASWTKKANWLVAADSCTWYGVECDAGHTTVQSLDVAWNNLKGTIPASLGNLTSLISLRLDGNLVSGSIPPQLGNLTNLQSLHMDNSQLSGSIPAELGGLISLQSLWLNSNHLSGSIPPQLGNLTSLTNLDLDNNQLSGSIPAQLASLSKLKTLFLQSNRLSGSIPAQLGNLTGLQILELSWNQLSGGIPPELASMTGLQSLALQENQLSGSIPAQLSSLTGLQALHLDNNQLSGSIPTQLGALTSLKHLGLSGNQLSGSIPTSLTNLSLLYSDNSDLRWNAFYTTDTVLRSFLNAKQAGETGRAPRRSHRPT